VRKRRTAHEISSSPPAGSALVCRTAFYKISNQKEVRNIEFEAKEQLMKRLDKNLLDHAKELSVGESPQIVDVYRLQGLAEVHCYLKTAHQFDPAEVEALLQFADPLEAACHCWEMNSHEYRFPICDLLKETKARELFELAKPEPPAKLSVRGQLRAAVKEAHQHPVAEERAKGGEAR